MSQKQVRVVRQKTCDTTLDEILKSIEFEDAAGNALVGHSINPEDVILTFAEV